MDLYSKVAERKASFWRAPEYNDVSFVFSDSDRILSANKTVLALMSPVLNAMFFGTLSEKANPVTISDIEADTFEQFLQSLYTDEVRLETVEQTQKIFYAANKYEVPFIEDECKKFLLRVCHTSDLPQMKYFAELFSIKEIVDLCDLLISNSPNRGVPAEWVPYKRGSPLPTTMNIVGFDSRGYPLGIGRFEKRFTLETDVLPGEFSVATGLVTSTWGGKSYQVPDDIELLCNGDLDWIPSKRGEWLEKAVIGGEGYLPKYPPEFQKLGVGKVELDGKISFGKIVQEYQCLFISKDGQEVGIPTGYFMLVDHNFDPKKAPKPKQVKMDYSSGGRVFRVSGFQGGQKRK